MKEPRVKKDEQSRKKKILKNIMTGLFIALIIFFASIYYILQWTNHTKYPIVVVTSGSMEPTIYRGDMLIIKYEDPSLIKNGTIEGKEGDIILFDTHGVWPNPVDEFVVHRVVGKYFNETDHKWYFITKGDHNPDTDPPGSYLECPVPEDKIIGVVVMIIPKLGNFKIFLDENNLTLPLTILMGILIICSCIVDYMKPKDEEQKEEKENSKIDKKELPEQKEKINMGV